MRPQHHARVRALAPVVMPALALLLLAGCGNAQRLSEIGRPPELSPLTDPTKAPDYRPVSMPMPAAKVASTEPNSLWRAGSRDFLKDQRASQVGDIMTILVNTTDSADVENASQRSGTGNETMGMPNMFGLEGSLGKILKNATASSLVSTNSTNSWSGSGIIKRNEAVTISLAATVTQVLPNGNLVVAARQELRVNSELRELTVSGVVRPSDINSDNTVSQTRLAEARITYGGRGQNTDVQNARWGQQVLDNVLPF
jgi:flagellar L-ring protein precursor FlgH